MLGKIFGFIVIISVIFSFATGRSAQVASAVTDGAASAVTLTISLCGMMCLWSGIINVLNEAGFTEKLGRLISPLLRFLYPEASRKKKAGDKNAAAALQSVCANMSANILGIGNAATPLGIDAMQKLHEVGGRPQEASADMMMLAVFNCASLQVIPTTLFALRSAAGSADVFGVLVPVWICSLLTAAFAVVCLKALLAARYYIHRPYRKTKKAGQVRQP